LGSANLATPINDQLNAYYHTQISEKQLYRNCNGNKGKDKDLPDVNDVWVCYAPLVQNGNVISEKFQIKRPTETTIRIYYVPSDEENLVELTPDTADKTKDKEKEL
jgi:hypothetical protein